MNKVKIIVAGANGRMGRIITRLVRDTPDCELAGAVDLAASLKELEALPCAVSDNLQIILDASPNSVVVDFTSPDAGMAHAEIVTQCGARMVMGTTGLNDAQKNRLAHMAEISPILWSANMSVGINVLLAILPQLTAALGEDYDIEMMELHHKRKKDSPSGTALMLAESAASGRGWDIASTRNSHRDGIIGPRPHKEIGVQALRGGDVVGIHSIYYLGPGEIIEITHQAESRENFAQGAIRAAIWLNGRGPGELYSMRDVISSRS